MQIWKEARETKERNHWKEEEEGGRGEGNEGKNEERKEEDSEGKLNLPMAKLRFKVTTYRQLTTSECTNEALGQAQPVGDLVIRGLKYRF